MRPDGLAIGVDIGGTRSKLGLVDLATGQVLEMQLMATETRSAGRFIDGLAEGIARLLQRAQGSGHGVRGVGVGVTGFVGADGSVDSTYGFLPFMEDYPLAQLLAERSGLACRVDNDARLVALGEALYGAGRAHARVLVLTLGTGLGLGLVVEGRFEAALPHAHMAGHISIRADDGGPACYCGRHGCLESLVSASGLVAAAQAAGWAAPGGVPSAEALFEAAQRGDAQAQALLTRFVADLKTGLGNYVNLFAPDLVVLGGGVAKSLAPYLAQLGEMNLLAPYKRFKLKLALSALDERAGVLGAAALFNH